MKMLYKTEDVISVDRGAAGVERQPIYERRVVTKILVSKISLEKQKKALEEELAQVNLDLSQIAEDERDAQ
jgi:hypothetical protein